MLTRTEIDFFRDQGYLRIPNWLDAAEVERLKALADAELARARDERTRGAWDLMEAAAPAVFRLSRIASRHEAFRAAALDARGCAAARQLLGEDAVWCVNRHNMMVVKAPRVARPINWHQDGVNWDHPNMLSLMVFLESADAENGCLQVVPGAHKLGLLPPRAGTGDMDLDDPAQAALARQAVPVCAAPGDALFLPLRPAAPLGAEPFRARPPEPRLRLRAGTRTRLGRVEDAADRVRAPAGDGGRLTIRLMARHA
ncbi:MAG: phytanoyl-CoA dioxygenase family protein [Planctomycetota bacterium]|nr:phytanoyl-CoA dioxygenase family protein [Planctomycetota bacterium]